MSHPWESYQALYVHIPFCVHKCAYCDFASYQIYNDHIMTDYARRLVEEISAWTPALPVSPTATVYFGGGTPSVLPLEDLAAIVTALKERGFWQHPAEATLEANPGTVDRERLRFYRQLGFDRLSLGIQSFQPGELAAMGRIHTAEQAEEAIALAREAGFRRISGDLIYGYPGQTVETVRDSLERLLDTGVDHVSVYGLTVEEGTLLAKQVREGKALLPSEDASGTMYDFLMEPCPRPGTTGTKFPTSPVPARNPGTTRCTGTTILYGLRGSRLPVRRENPGDQSPESPGLSPGSPAGTGNPHLRRPPGGAGLYEPAHRQGPVSGRIHPTDGRRFLPYI